MSGAFCGHCMGTGQVAALACGPDKSVISMMPCAWCRGAGILTDEQLRWMPLGQKARELRMARRETLGNAARRLGISVVELCDMEMGRADPARIIE